MTSMTPVTPPAPNPLIPMWDPEPTDEHVVARVLAGDQEAFSVLAQRHGQRVFRVCRAVTKDPDATEDCLQRTFLHALENLHQFRAEARFSTWLTRIALNVALSHIRQQNVQLRTTVSTTTGPDPNSPFDVMDQRENPEAGCYRNELRTLVAKAMESLSPRLRAVLTLRDLAELSTEETAQILGITEAAVKTRLLRARLRMRDYLAPLLGRQPAVFAPTIQ